MNRFLKQNMYTPLELAIAVSTVFWVDIFSIFGYLIAGVLLCTAIYIKDTYYK